MPYIRISATRCMGETMVLNPLSGFAPNAAGKGSDAVS
jgi:hypothetical protein